MSLDNLNKVAVPTLFGSIVDVSARVAGSGARLAKRDAIAVCLRTAAADEIEIAVAFLSGEIRQGRFGVGYAMLRTLLGDASPEPSLTLHEVDAALAKIATTTGKGSAAERAAQLRALFARATSAERDFLVRLLMGELRQGALEGVMIEAIAAAAAIPVADVRRAAMFAGNLGAVAFAALNGGTPAMAQFAIGAHRPVLPMLAQAAADVADALGRFGTAALEWKIDGARIQVHKAADEVRVFTRRRGEVTTAVPEIVDAIRALPVNELILDGEVIAVGQGGAPQPFQVTMRRFGRKLHVERLRAEVPLAAFYFDCLRCGAETLIDRPARERWVALDAALPSQLIVPRLVTSDMVAAEAFYKEALARGHEGVMVKALDSPYEAGSRGASWLKVKRVHTLDLVVLAAEWGHGRRRGWLSNLHLGARDACGGAWVMLGKTFKGLTDEMLEWQTRELLAREVTRDDYTVQVRPELVIEIAFNDLQESPQYPGGLALRFARVKGYRPDRRAQDADTIDTVRAIYEAQEARAA